MVTVSVCVATYNGSRHVEHQLRSILAELTDVDEVVVVDDASTDDTVSVVSAIGDPRISLEVLDTNGGYVRAFEHAIGRARGDAIFLSDQDDEWIPGRRAVLLDALENASVVASNVVLLGSDRAMLSPIFRRPWLLRSSQSRHWRRNRARMILGIAPYYGCAMAMRREVLSEILPFPGFLAESHDLWIAAVGNAARSLTHVDSPTVRRRLHDTNASSERPRSIRKVFRSRILVAQMLTEARRRQADEVGALGA